VTCELWTSVRIRINTEKGKGQYVADRLRSIYAYADGNPISENDPLGLAPFDPLWGAVYGATGGWTPSQGLINSTAGFGDAVSLNITSLVRDAAGTNDAVNKCSGAYRGGSVAGAAWGLAMGGAGLARGGLRMELGNWKQEGEWFFPQGTRGPHFHWGEGPGLQTHHLPWQAADWMANFASLVQRGKAWDDIANIATVGVGAGAAAVGVVHASGCGCE